MGAGSPAWRTEQRFALGAGRSRERAGGVRTSVEGDGSLAWRYRALGGGRSRERAAGVRSSAEGDGSLAWRCRAGDALVVGLEQSFALDVSSESELGVQQGFVLGRLEQRFLVRERGVLRSSLVLELELLDPSGAGDDCDFWSSKLSLYTAESTPLLCEGGGSWCPRRGVGLGYVVILTCIQGLRYVVTLVTIHRVFSVLRSYSEKIWI